jgi:hypothetical protein
VSLLESLELSSPPDILKESGSPSELLSLILPPLMPVCAERERERERGTHSATLLSCDLQPHLPFPRPPTSARLINTPTQLLRRLTNDTLPQTTP